MIASAKSLSSTEGRTFGRLKSPEETKSFATSYARKISNGKIIALIGNLGAGKTTFSQGFALGLGISESVISPTFKLVSEYEVGQKWLYHIDAYRLEGVNDFLSIGGEEYLRPERGITLIEWADIISDIFDENIIRITFSRLKENSNSRNIQIKGITIDV